MYIQLDDGTELFIRRKGRGTPLIALHGGMGFDHQSIADWIELLADEFDVITFDQRGNGRSSRPEDWSTVGDETWADDVEQLRTLLELERPIIFGHSYGVSIALRYAVLYPHGPGGLVLCNGAAATDHDAVTAEAIVARATPAQLAALACVFSPTGPLPSPARFLEHTLEALPLYFQKGMKPSVRATLASMHTSPEAFRRAQFGSRPDYDMRPHLGTIRVPTLVLQSEHDMICPREPCGEVIAAGIPAAELVVFEESGHFPFIEEPARFKAVMHEWSQRSIPSGGGGS